MCVLNYINGRVDLICKLKHSLRIALAPTPQPPTLSYHIIYKYLKKERSSTKNFFYTLDIELFKTKYNIYLHLYMHG